MEQAPYDIQVNNRGCDNGRQKIFADRPVPSRTDQDRFLQCSAMAHRRFRAFSSEVDTGSHSNQACADCV